MTHADLTMMLDFHYWARTRVLEAVGALSPEQFTRDLGSSFPSVRDTLVHLCSAEWNWYLRWNREVPAAMFDPNDFPDVTTLRERWAAQELKIRAFLASLDDDGVRQELEYRALDGRAHTSAFWEMFIHVVNHGTYHRGQVQTMLRQLGAAPAKGVDLIVYFRERRAAGA
ncbi:MAG: DinB family protein [Vicinamibacterales bacterium]